MRVCERLLAINRSITEPIMRFVETLQGFWRGLQVFRKYLKRFGDVSERIQRSLERFGEGLEIFKLNKGVWRSFREILVDA